MLRTRDELMGAVREIIGDNTSDKVLTFLEDLSDTLEPPAEDWKQKYEQNDKEWRERYQARFFTPEKYEDPKPEGEEVKEKPLTYDGLFKKEE